MGTIQLDSQQPKRLGCTYMGADNKEHTPYLIHRGSIAVDGISLTIASLDRSSFEVQIVPHTWTHTNMHGLSAGDVVNLETDMIGKYVVRAVELMGKITV